MAREITEGITRLGRELAERRLLSPFNAPLGVEDLDDFGIPQPPTQGPSVSRCPGGSETRVCSRVAGYRTLHPGVGACFSHDSRKEKAAGAWMMAHLIAREVNVSPWEALLLAVRRAATHAFFYESKLASIAEGDDDAIRPGGTAYDWVQGAERSNQAMARYSKMAIDAGVAAMMVSQARSEGETIARVLNQALGAVELTAGQELAIRQALRVALTDLETQRAVEASVVPGGGSS